MTLADELRARVGKKLKPQIEALCELLSEKLEQKIDKLPPRHAVGSEYGATAKTRKRARR